MDFFLYVHPILLSRVMGWHRNHETSYNQNAFIFKDNIFWHLSGPIEQIYTHNYTLSNHYNIIFNEVIMIFEYIDSLVLDNKSYFPLGLMSQIILQFFPRRFFLSEYMNIQMKCRPL